jgi:hypothetical protein
MAATCVALEVTSAVGVASGLAVALGAVAVGVASELPVQAARRKAPRSASGSSRRTAWPPSGRVEAHGLSIERARDETGSPVPAPGCWRGCNVI